MGGKQGCLQVGAMFACWAELKAVSGLAHGARGMWLLCPGGLPCSLCGGRAVVPAMAESCAGAAAWFICRPASMHKVVPCFPFECFHTTASGATMW
jgi:hypothetical protein